MSRKQHLIDEINQISAYDNHGSFKAKQCRKLVLLNILNDLYQIKIILPNFYSLRHEHVVALINFWKSHSIAISSMMNYMASLRYFLKKINHTIEHIDNGSLGLKKSRTVNRPFIDEETLLKTLHDPLCYLLIGLQIQFGLTFKEAIELNSGIHLQEDGLYLSREITLNHTDRFVPILTNTQHKLIDILVQQTQLKGSLKNILGESHLRLCQNFTLSQLKLSKHIQYRYLYARNRLETLRASHSLKESRKIVMQETALRPNSAVWAFVYE